MFIVRADGNAKIGAGHLMRCLTIAGAVKKLPNPPQILVLCADEESGRFVSDRGFETLVLHTEYDRMEEELPAWKQWIKGEDHLILVDSYQVTDEYLSKLGQFGRVYLMDDLQDGAYPVDGIINYNMYADEKVYDRLYADRKLQLYLGGSYAPLREQFQNVEYHVRDRVEQVLLTTGAADGDNIAGAVMDRIYRKDLIYHVLVGRFSPHLAGWQERAEKYPNIQVHYDVQDMAGLMKRCDLAVTAGGSTVYELCAVGVPFIAFAYAMNQELAVAYLHDKDIAGSAGCWHLDAEGTAVTIEDLFERLYEDLELRRYYSKREHQLTDGLGADRIARRLCSEA